MRKWEWTYNPQEEVGLALLQVLASLLFDLIRWEWWFDLWIFDLMVTNLDSVEIFPLFLFKMKIKEIERDLKSFQ